MFVLRFNLLDRYKVRTVYLAFFEPQEKGNAGDHVSCIVISVLASVSTTVIRNIEPLAFERLGSIYTDRFLIANQVKVFGPSLLELKVLALLEVVF